MRRLARTCTVLTLVALIAVACGGGNNAGPSQPGQTAGIQRGGVLRLGLLSDVHSAFDPQKEYYTVSWEFYRCCLARTLLSYFPAPGVAGTKLAPDLATGLPQVSADGLTYTFHIKPNVHYGPPLQNVTVTSHDFVRALEREANPDTSAGGYSFYYSPIKGFDDFGAGKADTISGLSTPDDQTLVVTLAQKAGQTPYLFTMPATAPIPPNPDDPNARLGIAEGHTDDFGRFLVSTGPYMFRGSEQLDFSKPAKEQKPVDGYVPGKSIDLVRNPSWEQDRATDRIRKAYVDEIQATIGGTNSDIANKIQAGELDASDSPTPPSQTIRTYVTNPQLKPFLKAFPNDGTTYVMMKLSMPPFDDIHVRKAMNFATDKAGLQRLAGGPLVGPNATHIIPDAMIGGLLNSYDPYPFSIQRAKQEMSQSKYDTNHDGVCDASACKNVLTVIDQADPIPKEVALMQQDWQQIGITINQKPFQTTTMYTKCEDATAQVPLCPAEGWFKDFADPITFSVSLFGTASITPSCCNDALVGATTAQLRKWGYPDTNPTINVDQQIDQCVPLSGTQRTQCWANFDKYLMENVVPWVPYRTPNTIVQTSNRVSHYIYDDFAGWIAFDQLALVNGGK